MTELDMERQKKRLHVMRSDIFARRQDLAADWQALREKEIEWEEEGQKAGLVPLYDKLDRQDKQEIEAIDMAFTKMANGIYGICESCEEPIAAARLEAMPSSRYCLECAKEEEMREKARNGTLA